MAAVVGTSILENVVAAFLATMGGFALGCAIWLLTTLVLQSMLRSARPIVQQFTVLSLRTAVIGGGATLSAQVLDFDVFVFFMLGLIGWVAFEAGFEHSVIIRAFRTSTFRPEGIAQLKTQREQLGYAGRSTVLGQSRLAISLETIARTLSTAGVAAVSLSFAEVAAALVVVWIVVELVAVALFLHRQATTAGLLLIAFSIAPITLGIVLN